MKLEKYTGSPYNFTPYIHEVAKAVENPIKTLILCNLLNKLPAFNKKQETKKMYGKDYHFSYCQTIIAEKELMIPYRTFKDYIKRLNKDGLISSFRGRVKEIEGYYTTYYWLNLEVIQTFFPKDKKSKQEDKGEFEPHQAKTMTASPKFTKATGTNRSYDWIQTALDNINRYQYLYNNNQIDKENLNAKIQPIKSQLKQNNIQIKKDKNTNTWEIA